MQKSNNKNILGVVFLFVSFIYILSVGLSNKNLFFAKYDVQGTQKIYEQSQWQQSQNISADKVLDEWAIERKYTGWKNFVDENKTKLSVEKVKKDVIASIQKKGISDSTLYTYAGYTYVTGENPSLLNPEHPPLGKYIIGSSILLFGNPFVLLFIFCIVALCLVYAITYTLTKSFFSSTLAFALTSFFPLFFDQFVHGPQLELFQLCFALALIYFLLNWEKKRTIFLLLVSGFWYGCMLATKTFLPFFLLFSAFLVIYFFMITNKKIQSACLNFTIVTGVGLVIFVLTYFSFFLQGGTVRSFLGLQKYIVVFYQNAHIPFIEFVGNYIRLIFTGSWKFWDSARTISQYAQWNILWPFIFIVGTYSLVKNRGVLFIVFSLIYNLFLFITPIFPRYLLLLFVLYIISICQFIHRLWKK